MEIFQNFRTINGSSVCRGYCTQLTIVYTTNERTLHSTAGTREMAAKRVAVKAVDWVKLGSTIPKAALADFNALRTRHETIKGR